MRDPFGLDKLKRGQRIELFQGHDGAAELHHAEAPAQGCGMVHRRGREIDHVRREAEPVETKTGKRVKLVQPDRRQIELHTLGLARRARRIEHRRALAFILDWRARPGSALFQIGSGNLAFAIHEEDRDIGQARSHLGRDRQGLSGGEQDLRLGVPDNIGGLGRRQMCGDAGEIETGTFCAQCDLIVTAAILQQDGNDVAAPEATAPKKMRALVGAPLQLRECRGLPARRHLVGDLIRCMHRMIVNV